MLPKHLNSAKCLGKPEVKQYCGSLKKELPSQDETEKNKYRKIGGIIISMSMYVLQNTLLYLTYCQKNAKKAIFEAYMQYLDMQISLKITF